MDYYKNKEKKKYELNKAHMWPRNKEFFKSYAKQNPYFRFTVFIALGNKEKFLKTHLNSQSYCLRKVPGQTCEAGFRRTCFQASRSDSIHSCDLLCFPLAAVLDAPFAIFSCVWTAGSRKNYPAKEVASTTGSRGDVFVVRTSKPVENVRKNGLLWSRSEGRGGRWWTRQSLLLGIARRMILAIVTSREIYPGNFKWFHRAKLFRGFKW